VAYHSIQLFGRSDRERQRRNRHALLDQCLGLGKACLPVNGRFIALPIVHPAGFLGELVPHPG